MNAARLLKAMQGYLAPLMAPDGDLTIAATPTDVLQRLDAQAPQKWGVVLCWNGYEGRPDPDLDTWAEHGFSAFVRVPVGLPAVPGDALIKSLTASAGSSVLERIEWVSLAIRNITFTSDANDVDSRSPRLKHSTWVSREDAKLMQIHELRFEYSAGLDCAATKVPVHVP